MRGEHDEHEEAIGDDLDRGGNRGVAYQGINYTTREKAVDLGPIQVTTEHTRTIPLPPTVGAIALVGGLGLLFMGAKTA